MQTIICTGITGSDQIGCLNAVKAHAQKHGYDLQIIDAWEVAKKISQEPIDEATILNRPESYRQRLFEDTYREISRRLDRTRHSEKPGDKQFVVVATHTTFFWTSTYLEAFPQHLLATLNPDLFITIIHNMKDIKNNLDHDPYHRFEDITLSDILHWRDREVTNTSTWARDLGKGHFRIAHNEPAETLYGVIFRPEAKKIYASYPMSHVSKRQRDAAIELVDELRRRGYVVFDPGSIDDAEYVDQLVIQMARDRQADFVYTEEELRSLVNDVGDQTVKLDYLLIDQSDFVVVYYPGVTYAKYIKDRHKVVARMYIPLSAGVICEMVHGYQGGQRVYAVWLPKGPTSPFFRYHCQRVFRSKIQLLHYLKRYHSP
jgi:adenylate kinase